MLDSLAAAADVREAPRGMVLAVEGEASGSVSFVVKGRVEASVSAPDGPVVVAVLHEGDCYGLGSLASDQHLQEATIRTLERVVVADVPVAAFQAAAELDGAAAPGLEAAVARLHVLRFLKTASPFTPLDPDSLTALVDRVQTRDLGVGETALEQGAPARECLLLLEGGAEAHIEEEGVRRRLATVYPGGMVGEAALLDESTHDVTVTVSVPSRWLVLHRDDLITAMRASRSEAAQIAELVALSGRPVRHPGVQLHTVASRHGETVGVLKDPARGIYHRLSVNGSFLWERMDGHHTVKDLTLDLLEVSHVFQPQMVGSTVGALAAEGLIDGVSLPASVLAGMPGLPFSRRLLLAARRALEAKLVVPRLDRLLLPLWRFPVHFLFTAAGLLTLAAVAAAGLVAFGAEAGRAGAHASGLALLLGLSAGYLLSILVHEAGHAFTTIKFGREISRGGVGWYWFGPVAFVDTSDMWIAPRSQRILVTAAGPAASLLVGSVLALIALPLDPGGAKAILLTLVLFNYAIVLLNLNPLLEYDGYYVLMDALDRPNLRRECLQWLPRGLPAAIRQRSLRGHLIEVTYGIGALLYVAAMTAVTILAYRLLLQHAIDQITSSGAASALGWTLAVLVAILAFAGAAQDMARPAPAGP